MKIPGSATLVLILFHSRPGFRESAFQPFSKQEEEEEEEEEEREDTERKGESGRREGEGDRNRKEGERNRREEEMVEVEDSEGDELVDIERVEDREEDCRGEDLRTSHQVRLAQPICLSVCPSVHVCPSVCLSTHSILGIWFLAPKYSFANKNLCKQCFF